MKNDFDGDSLSSLTADANGEEKTDLKTEKATLKMQIIDGNSKIDLGEYSAVFDISLVRAAFEYYKYQKDKRNPPLDFSGSSSNIWDNSYAIIKKTDCTEPSDSTSDLEATLSDLQVDTDLISEWPKFNTDFLNLYNFFDEQIDSSDSLGNTLTTHENEMNENEVSDAVVNFETTTSDSKSLCNDSSESTQPETDTESLETRSAVSKSSLSSGQLSENIGEARSALKHFHVGGYFPEELDYEPSEAGETEARESDNEFCVDNSVKEKESGSFPHYCSHDEVSENSTLQETLEKVGELEEHAETCARRDFISFLENNFQSGTGRSSLQNNSNGYFEYEEEDDEDSESDSEHSFKRNSSRNSQVNDLEPLHPPSIKCDVSKVSQLNTINEVMLYICEQCKCGNINEAIAVANRYIAVSAEAVQLEIFKELFVNVIDLIKSSVFPVGDARISKGLEEVMDLFHQSKLFNSDLCSLVISECFGCEHAIGTGKEFLSFVQKIKVPVNSYAISSYMDIVTPSEIPSLELISFLEYVKCVCNLSCPKTLLSEALGRFSKQEDSSLVGFFRLCKFLCSLSSKEVDIKHLQNFIEFCIRNDDWTQISGFFKAWCNTDGHLISCLARSFLFRPEDVGLFYQKLADEIYKNVDVSLYLVSILGQVGVCLLLEVFSRKQYESAFDVLFTLHKRNINYLELQAGLYKPPAHLKSLPNFADMFVFPFTVAFAALDICLHLERFKDAYRVFESFSLHLPADMDGKLKLKVRSRRFRYLLKLAQELFSIDPLKLGLQAFHDISPAAEDFSLEELEDFAEEIQVIYNKYLTYAVNGCQLHTALELFKYSEGAMKEEFVVHPQVLRGLLVTFAQNDKMDEAYKFFLLGCVMKVYNVEQTETEEFIWCLTVMSSWTIFEVEFTIKNFIENVCLVWHSNCRNRSCLQPSVKIVFKESEEECLEIDCLKKSHSIDSARGVACKVLQSMDSDIQWIENPTYLELVFKTVYNYWINKSPNFLWRKNSRKFLLEDVRPNAEFKIQLPEEDFGFKYSSESNCVKSLEKVLDPLTPESSVADSAYQPISDKTSLHSLTLKKTLPESCQTVAPETTFLENSDRQSSDLIVSRSIEQEQIISDLSVSRSIEQEKIISDLPVPRSIGQEQIISDFSVSRSIGQEQIISDFSVSRSIGQEQIISDFSVSRSIGQEQLISDISVSRSILQEQIISDLSVSRSNEQEQIISDLTVSRSIEQEQIVSDLSVSESIEQEQIISSSNQLSPFPAHSSQTTCPTPDGKLSETDAPENILTDFCSKSPAKAISAKTIRKVRNKMQVFKRLGQLKSKRNALKIMKPKKKLNRVPVRNKPAPKNQVMLPTATEESLTETKNLHPESSKPTCSSKPCIVENFQVTLRNSAKDGVSRVVSHASGVKPAEPKNKTSVLNVPETVFQKIVLFLRSKVLLKRKDMQPQQQQQKANHLATQFIQQHAVSALDKKTMQLLNKFADDCV